jgi:DNA-directed RNA polymerase specialized sigma24 family protein
VSVGELVWSHLSAASQVEAKSALAHVVALRESKQLEVVDRRGDCFRGWLWPLDSPKVAVCVLGVRVPKELKRLSGRERQCLEFLSQGLETRLIAEKLKVSISTIHTHLKRA